MLPIISNFLLLPRKAPKYAYKLKIVNIIYYLFLFIWRNTMNRSRLLVFKLKEVIYTAIFIILGIILLIVLFNMFNSSKKNTSPTSKQTSSTTYNSSDNKTDVATYTPGIYTTSLELNNQYVNIEVTVDDHMVKNITLNNLSDTTAVMYPLLEPSVEYIVTELHKGTPLTEIECDDSNRYTHMILTDAISTLLKEAKVQ